MMLVALVILIAAYIVPVQDQIRPAPDGLRRAPPGGGLGRYKRLQDALVGVLISGVLGGLGGIMYIIAGASEWQFEAGVAGFGFPCSCGHDLPGQWKPHRWRLPRCCSACSAPLASVYSGFRLPAEPATFRLGIQDAAI